MIDPTVSRLADQNMRAANMVEQIRAALRSNDGDRARSLFDRVRDDPEQARAVANALRGGTS